MSKHLSITRFLSVVLLLDILLIAAVSFTGTQADMLLAGMLPGKFGPGMGAHMTGNHLLGALIVTVDSLLFLAAGFLVLLSASRQALVIGAGGIAKLLRGKAGLSQEDIAATSFAVAEEQKAEIRKVHTGRNLVWIGAVLLLLAFPAVCFTYAQADIAGQPLLQDAGGAVANAALTIEDAAVFAADQLLDAVLLDIPRVFDWHLSSLRPGHHHMWLKPFVLLYHVLDKLIVLASFFAAWRSGNLRAYVLQMAGVEAVPALAALRSVTQTSSPAHSSGFRDALPANDHHAPAVPTPEPEPIAEMPPVPIVEHHEPEAAVEPVHGHPADGEPEPLEASILEVPVYVDPVTASHHAPPQYRGAEASDPPEDEPHSHDHHGQENPQPLPASVLEVPVYVSPSHNEEHHSDAPLALHELKDADEPAGEPVAAAPPEEPKWEGHNILPYKRTALHLNQEFDA